MGNLKCGISQKRLILERNGQKFGTRGTTVHICKALLMPDSLSLVWGHLVHFAKILIRNTTASTVFITFQANFIQSIIIRVNIGYYFFLQSARN